MTNQNINQYFKTKICPFYKKGTCKFGKDCQFAHFLSELREKKNLENTKICPKLKTSTCNDVNCKYAHSKEELKYTDEFYKTRLCTYWQKGKCVDQRHCRHAHGMAELRLHNSNKDPTHFNRMQDIPKALQSILNNTTYDTNVFQDNNSDQLFTENGNWDWYEYQPAYPIVSTPEINYAPDPNSRSTISFASTDTDLYEESSNELSFAPRISHDEKNYNYITNSIPNNLNTNSYTLPEISESNNYYLSNVHNVDAPGDLTPLHIQNSATSFQYKENSLLDIYRIYNYL